MPKSKLLIAIENNDPTVISADFSYRKLELAIKLSLIDALKKNTHVTEINLSQSYFTNEEIISVIKACPRLKSLIVLHLDLNDSVAIALSQNCPAFEALHAYDNHFTGIGIAALSQLPHLKFLDLGLNPVTYDDMSAIAQFPSLQRLYLTGAKIGDEGARRLSTSQLTELHLGANDLTEKGALYLSQMKYVKILDLRDNKIGDEGAAVLTRLKSIETLILADNGIGDVGAIALSRIKRLRNLDLSGNDVGDDGARSFADSTLELLILDSNKIGYRGAGALEGNKVTRISLDGNSIGTSWQTKFHHRSINMINAEFERAAKQSKT